MEEVDFPHFPSPLTHSGVLQPLVFLNSNHARRFEHLKSPQPTVIRIHLLPKPRPPHLIQAQVPVEVQIVSV